MSHSYAQIEELLTLLKSLPAEQGAMTPGELKGYVTGLIVCPETIPLFEWQPPVWGDEGAVPFGGLWKAEVASRIVADHYNRISESLFYGSEQYVPLYEVDDESDEPLCQWRSKKGPPRRCKKGPLGGCGLVPVVHGRAPRATRRALNRLTRRRAREGPVGPRGQAWAGWSVQLAVGV